MNLNRKPNQLDMKRSVIIMLVLILSAMAHGQKKWTLEDSSLQSQLSRAMM